LAVQLGLSHETQLPPLTWDQVREMASDLVEFGSHTVYHSFLPLLSSSAARTELEASKRRIEEETGRPCRMFAYPNGDYDAVSAAHVAAAGYKAALTQRLGVNRPSTSPYELARIHVPPDYAPHAFAFRVSTPPVTDLLVRAWTLMRSARNCFRAAPAA
jgi:peptidoglycan/xylan/chitin deacetylase (PgdA/CDA1 family)